jgi:hypothetical protein
MAVEILRFKAIDEAKRSSAKKLEIRRNIVANATKHKPASKPAARKDTTR